MHVHLKLVPSMPVCLHVRYYSNVISLTHVLFPPLTEKDSRSSQARRASARSTTWRRCSPTIGIKGVSPWMANSSTRTPTSHHLLCESTLYIHFAQASFQLLILPQGTHSTQGVFMDQTILFRYYDFLFSKVW